MAIVTLAIVEINLWRYMRRESYPNGIFPSSNHWCDYILTYYRIKTNTDRLLVTPNCLYCMFVSNIQGASNPQFCITPSIRNHTIHTAMHIWKFLRHVYNNQNSECILHTIQASSCLLTILLLLFGTLSLYYQVFIR